MNTSNSGITTSITADIIFSEDYFIGTLTNTELWRYRLSRGKSLEFRLWTKRVIALDRMRLSNLAHDLFDLAEHEVHSSKIYIPNLDDYDTYYSWEHSQHEHINY